ncbi:D-alanyl-D-alanine carboxypeptidase family protein [Pelagibacterium halotolerans]|uniref:D-alanyl-D-alanine carboxypeptidase n=1 Tax=Pelagibacterium halotolerans (strain DSM 22347 / JCM 15775 / CGMCC 1.7692 / B2) TaxID=1082931 RepID=G4RFJ8_PELHB|nr:D-alanyl-D-alanine carboxypeptidase family protein [Pelagibacterium halotolerans]AEQ53000.1 D-alanyl-D-alanine carboxypeptidase [Pelagibacterium halotolerans B2]QJR17342.1 D-alanyl-D-alanine carboxypeptidase [Pelagibacterium halotolerans]SEA97756.1 D-alanyl-D-alanine carboxypeptidase [Pelagibacterium halotolerans]
MQSVRRLLSICVLVLGTLSATLSSALALPQLLIDMRTNEVLFENEAGIPWHPASLTKLMTALIAFEAIETGQASLSTPVITSANALSVAPSKLGLPEGTAITLEDALYILVVKSANDIAVAIGETIAGSEPAFVDMMNARAAIMGLTGTHFVNPHGLHDPAQVTTARDIAMIALTIRARFPQYDALFSTRTVALGESRSHSNNELLTGFSGTDGMKTGYVCASGLNIVATVTRGGRQLMAVTLGANSSRERGEMTAQMMFSGFAGGYRGTGRTVTAIANQAGLAPVDMRPNICGAGAPDYSEQRAEIFSAGLDGQISYLTDTIVPPTHTVATLGRLADVPLPRPRPDSAMAQAGIPGQLPASGFGDSSIVSLTPSP